MYITRRVDVVHIQWFIYRFLRIIYTIQNKDYKQAQKNAKKSNRNTWKELFLKKQRKKQHQNILKIQRKTKQKTYNSK